MLTEVDGIQESQEFNVDIREYLPKDIQLADSTAGTVVVMVSIEKYGTKTFTIPTNKIILENAIAGLKPSVAVIGNIEIRVRGSKAELENLAEIPKVYVDLEKYTTAGTINVPIQAELPQGCSLADDVTLQVVLAQQ